MSTKILSFLVVVKRHLGSTQSNSETLTNATSQERNLVQVCFWYKGTLLSTDIAYCFLWR